MITVPAFRSAFRRRGARRIPDERLSRGRTAAAGRRTAAVCAALAVLVAGLAVAPAHADDSTPPPVDEAQAASAGAAPDRPTGLTVAAAHDRVALSWDDPGDPAVTGYAILRRDRAVDAVGTFHTIEDDTATAATAYTDTTVTSGGSYVYRVKALNAHGASRWSSYARADIPQPPVIEEVEPPEPEPDPEPTAQPQSTLDDNEVWRATLTVGARGAAQVGFRPASGTLPAFGSLDPATFSHNGADYTVYSVYHRSGGTVDGLYLGITPLPGEAVRQTLALAIGDDRYPLDAVQGGELYWSGHNPGWSSGDSVVLALKTNSAAAGKPTISGTIQEGQLLVASMEDISDTNGIPDAEMDVSLLLVEGAEAIHAPGAVAWTIRPGVRAIWVVQPAWVGKRLQVQVTFDDADNFSETVRSDATDVVVASPYTDELWSGTVGSANSATFRTDAAHRINSLQLNVGGVLRLTMTGPLKEDFALQIGDRQILLEDIGRATRKKFTEQVTYDWDNDFIHRVLASQATSLSILTIPSAPGVPTATIQAYRTTALERHFRPGYVGVELDAVATDTGGGSLTYMWTTADTLDGAAFAVGTWAPSDAARTTFKPGGGSIKANIVVVTVTDNADNSVRAYEYLAFTDNTAPVIDALTAAPSPVDSGATVDLGATVTDPDDPEGRYATFLWEQVTPGEDDAQGVFGDSSKLSTTWTAPVVRSAATVTLRLTVTDEDDSTATGTVNVTVNAAEEPLRVTIAEGNQTVLGNRTLALTGAVTGALDPNEVTYSWTGTGGGFSPADTAITTWTAPLPTRAGQTFTLTLTVTEGDETANATVTIAVPANVAPTVTGLPTSEEVDGSAELRIDATASDPDGDTLMFTWTDQDGIGGFDDFSVLNTVWTAPAPQRYPQNTVLTLTVADSVGDVTRRVNVQVRGNFAPLVRGGIFEATATDVFFGNTPVNLDKHIVADSDANLTYQWSSSGDLGSFNSPMTEHTIWTTPRATEDPQMVTLTLTVTDAIGATTFSKDVIVDGNHPPGVTLHATPADVDGGATVQLGAAVTNIESDMLTYQWSATGGTLASDTQPNAVWTAPAAERTPTVVTLTLTVTDDGEGPGITTKTATITVLADAEPTGTVTADITTVYGGKEVTLTAAITDDDRSDVTYQWTATPDSGSFAASDSASTTWTAPDATDMQQSVTLTLRVADALGYIDIPTIVTVHENQSPTVTLGNDEGVGGGDAVSLAPTVADPEDDNLTYAWTAAPNVGTFQNSSARSTTWTAPAATRDARVVVLTLTVTDDGAGNLQGSNTVTFTVRPLDTMDTNDARSAPSFMSRHEGIQAGPLSDELRWLFPRRVPYTDYEAIGFDGFEVQSRSRGPGEDWNWPGCCWRGWPPTTSSGRPRPESATRSRPRPTAGTASGGCGRCTRPLRASPTPTKTATGCTPATTTGPPTTRHRTPPSSTPTTPG